MDKTLMLLVTALDQGQGMADAEYQHFGQQ
jgi:hypothetical protein